MSKARPKSVRVTLKKACDSYLIHKKRQLDKFIAEYPYQPSKSFFIEALGNSIPQAGFNDWVRCIYFEILSPIFNINIGSRFKKHSLEQYYVLADNPKYYPCGRLKSYDKRDEFLNQWDPQLVLYNLKVLIGLLNLIMNYLEPNFNALKENFKYKKEDYICTEGTVLSLQIEKALQNLIALAHFTKSLSGHQCQSSWAIDSILICLDKAHPKFEEYLKWIMVKELNVILDNAALSDAEAIKQARLHIKETHVKSLLERNHQSASEQRLKLLSLISIIFGIGIFTTFGLMAKRLYDSGGTSINFFKPLSTNLRDSVEETVESAFQEATNVAGRRMKTSNC